MTTEKLIVVTSQTDRIAEIQAAMAALQADLQDASKLDAQEKQAQLARQRDAVIDSIVDLNELRSPDADDWDKIIAAECVGIQIVYTPGVNGEPPIVTTRLISSLIAKPTRAAATTTTSNGKSERRNLFGEFEAVASPAQVALLNADKAMYTIDGSNSKRGRQNGFMVKVTADNDSSYMPSWAAEHGLG